MFELPDPLAVGAVYGLAVMKGGNAAGGEALADHILSPAGRAVLDRYGFPAP